MISRVPKVSFHIRISKFQKAIISSIIFKDGCLTSFRSLSLNEFLEIIQLWLRQQASRANEMAKSSFISAPAVERTKTVLKQDAFRTNTQGITRTKTRLKTASGLPPSTDFFEYLCLKPIIRSSSK